MPTENRSSNTEQMVSARVCAYTPGQSKVELQLIPPSPLPSWLELGQAVTVRPAKQHQGEPVKYLDLISGNVFDDAEPIEQAGRRAIPITDPTEVERPSQIALSLQTKLQSVESERDRLRTKLAEQEHSARELLRIIGMSVQGSAAYNRAVIAFHDSLNADTKPN